MIFGGSPGLAYPSSRMSPGTLDWPIIGTDPNDDTMREGAAITNRSWHLWRSNPYARALTKVMEEGVLGPNGLVPRSIFRGNTGHDLNVDPVIAEQQIDKSRDSRAAIEKSLRSAWRGKRFDATGQNTKREMSNLMLLSMLVTGNGFAIRQWLPNRPGRQYQATCWRVIDPQRVSNPSWAPNTATAFEGVKLDDNGCPIGVWVQRRNPYALQVVDYKWDFVPWYASDGSLNVTHLKAPGRPDQILGVGWYDSIMSLVHQLGEVTDAYVVAKRVQACIGYIEASGNPTASVASQRNGATSSNPTGASNGRMYPGMRIVVPKETTITPLNWNFQGGDHSAFQDSLLTAISAAWGLPMEFVQHRLTKSNMASARVALGQAYRTFTSIQEMLIGSVETPWAESVVIEDLARGNITVDESDLDDVLAFRWNRPAKQFPDPQKEANGGLLMKELGKAPSTILAEQGLDHETEILIGQQDRAFEKAHGFVAIPPTAATAPAGTDAPVDPEADPADEAAPGDEVAVTPDSADAA